MTANIPQWMRDLHRRQTVQLIEDGFVRTDEFGNMKLTEKGKKRAAARLDKLPAGDEILLNLAFCEHHGIAVSVEQEPEPQAEFDPLADDMRFDDCLWDGNRIEATKTLLFHEHINPA